MGLVFVENFHGGILLHVMVPVKVILKLVVRVESRLYVFDRACETENLVLHNTSQRLLIDDLGTRMIKNRRFRVLSAMQIEDRSRTRFFEPLCLFSILDPAGRREPIDCPG